MHFVYPCTLELYVWADRRTDGRTVRRSAVHNAAPIWGWGVSQSYVDAIICRSWCEPFITLLCNQTCHILYIWPSRLYCICPRLYTAELQVFYWLQWLDNGAPACVAATFTQLSLDSAMRDQLAFVFTRRHDNNSTSQLSGAGLDFYIRSQQVDSGAHLSSL